jgi:hypothetical protein
MTMGLRERLNDLATQFADAILAAIRETPLADLTGGAERKAATVAADRPAKREGRLPRRTAEQVGESIEKVAGLLAKAPDGLRAEAIRAAGSFDVREMPRILKQGVTTKRLRILGGQKRATVYGLATAKPVKATKKRAVKKAAKKK